MFADGQGELGADDQHQGRGDPEPDGFALFTLAGRHLLPGFLDRLEDRERAGVQQAAGLGRLDAAGMADKQRDTQNLLDLADLHPERGLRDVKLLGGARHVAGLHHAHEVSELAQVHERLFGGRLAHSLERFAAKWELAHRDEPRCGEPLIIQGLPGPH